MYELTPEDKIDVRISEALGHRTFYADGRMGAAWSGGCKVWRAGGAYRFTGELSKNDGLPVVVQIPKFTRQWDALAPARHALLKTEFAKKKFIYELWGLVAGTRVNGDYDLSADWAYDLLDAPVEKHAEALANVVRDFFG